MVNDETQVIFNKKYPLVKIFEVDDSLFAYDAKTNLLVTLSYDDLEQYVVDGYFKDNNPEIKGVFIPGGFSKLIPSESELPSLVKNQLDEFIPRKFALEITEKCTLRCKYCFFSNENNSRKHSNFQMSLSTAQKAINYYFQLYTRSFDKFPHEYRRKLLKIAPPNISWWGGEPLLNFDLIVESKKYFEQLPWSKHGIELNDLAYSIVTNFTVLNDLIINFLVSNKIYTFISLDGEKEDNDLNRVFENGKGSYDIVIDNIDKLINKYPDYCKQYVIIQSVSADNVEGYQGINKIRKRFLANTPFAKVLKVTGYPQRNKNEYISKPLFDRMCAASIFAEFGKLLENISGLSVNDLKVLLNVNKELRVEFEKLYSLGNDLIYDNPPSKDNCTKHFSCPAGVDNVFISQNGDIHICNKTDYSFPFGNINNGPNVDNVIDIDSLVEFYSKFYHSIRFKCSNCWAARFCNICPASLLNDAKFVSPTGSECEFVKQSSLIQLKKYIKLLSYDELFEKLESIVVEEKNVNFLNYQGSISYKNSIV